MSDNKKAEPIKKYYIAYFDLLGYKNFFQGHPDKVENFLQAIHDAIATTQGYVQSVNTSLVGVEIGNLFIRTKIFSDNVLLCLETSDANIEYPRFLAFLCIIADIQRHFVLSHGLFLRGGITIGELSFNEDFVFGQGLIDAVALEERAIYPRIVMGKPIIDYASQLHFVKEELALFNSMNPAIDIEKIYLQWQNHLLFPVVDGVVVLNYLYYPNIRDMLGQAVMQKMLDFLKNYSPDDYQKFGNFESNQKERLMLHKARIIQKIEEFGKYDDISEAKDADIRERILKKYIWALSFHNYVCTVYGIPDCMIQSGSTFDIRFMKMTVEIFEDSLSEVKQQEGK